MLHLAYRLRTDAQEGARLSPLPRKTWRPTLILSRSLCVFESVPCTGLAWHERSKFARTQAARLAPFARYGCNAAVVGSQLMLWFWDETEVSDALHAAGLGDKDFKRIVEPLLTKPPVSDGVHEVQSSAGTDRLTISNGAIVGSTWAPAQKPSSPESDPPLQLRPWARELLGGAGLADATAEQITRSIDAQKFGSMLCGLALLLTTTYAAFRGGNYLGMVRQVAELESQAEEADRKLGNLLSLSKSNSTDSHWIDSYSKQGAGIRLDTLLDKLGLVLEQNGVVISELEIRGQEVRVAARSAGGEIDLPRLLSGLTAIPGVNDVQLRDNVDLSQATFNFQAPGFMALLAPPPEAREPARTPIK